MLVSNAPGSDAYASDASHYLPGFVLRVCERLGGRSMSLADATMLLNVFLPKPKEPLLREFWAGVLGDEPTGARARELMRAFGRFPELFAIPGLLASLGGAAHREGVSPEAARVVTVAVFNIALQRFAEGDASLFTQNSEAFTALPAEVWMPPVAQAHTGLNRRQLRTLCDHYFDDPHFKPGEIAAGLDAILSRPDRDSDAVCAQLAAFTEAQARNIMSALRGRMITRDIAMIDDVAQQKLPARQRNAMLQGVLAAVLPRNATDREVLAGQRAPRRDRDDGSDRDERWARLQEIHADLQVPCQLLRKVGPLLAPWTIPDIARPEVYSDLPGYLGFSEPERLVQLAVAQRHLIEDADWKVVEALLERLCTRAGHFDGALYARNAEALLLGLASPAPGSRRKGLDVGEVFRMTFDAGRHFPAGDRNWARVTAEVLKRHGEAQGVPLPGARAASASSARSASSSGSSSSSSSNAERRATAMSTAVVPRGGEAAAVATPRASAQAWAVAPAAGAGPGPDSGATTSAPAGKKPGALARFVALLRR